MIKMVGERPDRRGFEPGQAQLRRDLVRQIFDANFNSGPYAAVAGNGAAA